MDKKRRRSKKKSKKIKKLLKQEYRNHIRSPTDATLCVVPFVNNPWPWDYAIEATGMPVSVIEATRMPVNVIEATAGNSEFCECNHQPWIREAQQQLRNRDESPEWKQYSQNIRDQQDRLQHDRLVQAENEAWELIERGQRRPLYFEPSPFSDFVRDAQEQLRKRDNLR